MRRGRDQQRQLSGMAEAPAKSTLRRSPLSLHRRSPGVTEPIRARRTGAALAGCRDSPTGSPSTGKTTDSFLTFFYVQTPGSSSAQRRDCALRWRSSISFTSRSAKPAPSNTRQGLYLDPASQPIRACPLSDSVTPPSSTTAPPLRTSPSVSPPSHCGCPTMRLPLPLRPTTYRAIPTPPGALPTFAER